MRDRLYRASSTEPTRSGNRHSRGDSSARTGSRSAPGNEIEVHRLDAPRAADELAHGHDLVAGVELDAQRTRRDGLEGRAGVRGRIRGERVARPDRDAHVA